MQDITTKDYLSDHSLIEWKFLISGKASEKIQKSRRNLTKINKENFNIDLKKNLQKETTLYSIITIVNQSLTTGTFLEDWKIASVRPVIKGLNLDSELINYRPIINLSFLSKIIERQLKHNYKNIFKINHSYLNTKVLIDKII